MNKLADDLTNPKSMKEMWQTIKSLKSYKQIKPTSRQFSDSDHIAFLHQISSAPDTAECIQMDLPSFDIQTINRTCFSASELTKFKKHVTSIPQKVQTTFLIACFSPYPLTKSKIWNLWLMKFLTMAQYQILGVELKLFQFQKKAPSSIITNNRPICLLSVLLHSSLH